ncbi:hypothetical protein BJ742DRAFT_882412 [Cladochytrium replicatum]|nr:hypothetical protein BJ742DRAFT_882412 [Cladochytrium replicatum]
MRIQVEHIVLLSVATLLVVTATYLANIPTLASLRSSAAQQDTAPETPPSYAPEHQNPDLKTVTPSTSQQQHTDDILKSQKTFEWISDRFRTKLLDMAARDVILENKTEIVQTRWSGPSFPIYVHPSPDLVSDVIRNNGGWYDCYGHLASLEKILADPTRPNVVIDVGGNIGSCALMYGALGFKVFSFEPAEHNFRLFSASIKTNVENGILNKSGPKSVTLYPLGASDVDEVKNIYIQQGNNGNSIISSIVQDETQFGHESIITAQVSSIINERIGFAKLDCQGYEPYALRGMKALIEKHGIDQITFELDPQFFKAVGVTNPIETLQFLDSMGYTIVRANGVDILKSEGFSDFIVAIASTAEDLKAYSNKEALPSPMHLFDQVPDYRRPGVLSQNSSKENETEGRCARVPLPRISLMTFIGTFILLVLILATVPTAVIVFLTSLSSVDTLAERIIVDTVDRANNELSQILNGISSSTLLFIRSKVARAYLTTHTSGYGYDTDFNFLALQLMNSTPGLVYLACGTASNLTGEVPSSWNQTYPNGTFYGVDANSNEPNAFFFDYENSTNLVSLPLDIDTGDVIGPPKDNVPAPLILSTGSVYWMIDRKAYGPYWLAEFVDQARFTFAAVSQPMNITNVYGETKLMVPFGCGATMPLLDVTRLLRRLSPTSSSRLFLTNSAKLLIATNIYTRTIAADGRSFVAVVNSADRYISEIGSTQFSVSSNIQSVTTQDGTRWKVASRHMDLRHGVSDFTLSVAIPRSEFFDSVETSIHRGVVITCIASALGVLVALGVVVLIVAPLKRMVNDMAKATKFEFREVENSLNLVRPSMFHELRALQETFATMVKTFAEAIIRKKATLDRRR